MSITKRGAFIVLEGIDRTGKTTQAKLLQEHLAALNVPSVAMRFPDRTTPIGSILNGYLAQGMKVEDHAVHLAFSANRWEAKDTILQHLRQGTSIICDRYAFSGVAFTAAKGIDVEWCKTSDRGLPRPDVVLYLDLAIEEAAKRGDYGNEIYEKEEIQKVVQGIYEEALFDSSYWKRIPANFPTEQLHQELCELALQVIDSIPSDSQEPERLWMQKL